MQILSNDSSPGFKISKDQLMNFFKPDHIHDGDSINKL